MSKEPNNPRSTAVLLTILLTGIAVLPVPQALAQVPVGTQFKVNTYTTSVQQHPRIEMDQEGDFVVVWHSFGSSSDDDNSIQGQRYNSDLTVAGSQFQVNTYTTDGQRNPALAVAPNGAFVVVWQSDGSAGSDTNSYSVHGQRYASDGTAAGGEIQVNTYTPFFEGYPEVAMSPNGDFVVVWQRNGGTFSEYIVGRRYSSGGASVGAYFLVSNSSSNHPQKPAVAVGPNGDFVVVWEADGSAGSDTSDHSIQGQRYASDGTATGSKFQVNSYTTSFQKLPEVAIDLNGDFVVVWESDGSAENDTSDYSIQGQRYLSTGGTDGSEFQINSYTTSAQTYSRLAVDPYGDFVVVWRSDGSDQDDMSYSSIQGQRYSSAGGALGSQFQANAYTTERQELASVAMEPEGDFVVVWDSLGSDNGDTDERSVQGRHFRVTGDVGDKVWLDADLDGVQDPDPSEPGIENVRVNLYDDISVFVESMDTDVNGNFLFEKKKVGDYFLEVELPAAYAFTSQDRGGDDTMDSDADPSTGQTIDFTIQEGVTDLDWDAGMTNGIGDRVWHDLDGNGEQDGGEPGIENVTVILRDSIGTQLDQKTTDSVGHFAFADLAAGSYFLEFTAPAGFAFTAADQGIDNALDSDPGADGTTPTFSFATGTIDKSWDAGLVASEAQVGNRVWRDDNGNGIQDGGEPGIAGVDVRLYLEPSTFVDMVTTTGDGFYSFTVPPEMYHLEIDCSADALTVRDAGLDSEDSDFDPASLATTAFVLALGAADGSWDAGLVDGDADGVICFDNCPTDANADQADADADSAGDVCDLCFGDNGTGDADSDGTCADQDCDDGDPLDVCLVFNDGFESGDTTAWSSTSK